MIRTLLRFRLKTSPSVCGSIRDAGGRIAEEGKAREDKFFYEESKRQMERMKLKLKQQKEAEIKETKEDIERMEAKLKKKEEDLKNIEKE